MREQEALGADQHRQQHRLGDPVRAEDAVEQLLDRGAVELDPARVALAHAVGEVGLDAPRREDGAVDVDGDERDALARGAVELLVRVEEALRRGGGERAHAGARGRDHLAEHRVLALEVRELDVVPAGDELGEPLDDHASAA